MIKDIIKIKAFYRRPLVLQTAYLEHSPLIHSFQGQVALSYIITCPYDNKYQVQPLNYTSSDHIPAVDYFHDAKNPNV